MTRGAHNFFGLDLKGGPGAVAWYSKYRGVCIISSVGEWMCAKYGVNVNVMENKIIQLLLLFLSLKLCSLKGTMCDILDYYIA